MVVMVNIMMVVDIRCMTYMVLPVSHKVLGRACSFHDQLAHFFRELLPEQSQ